MGYLHRHGLIFCLPPLVLAPPNAAVIWNAAFTERQAARGELPLPQCQWPARQAGRAGRSPISGSPPGTESQSTQAGSGVDEQYRRVDDDRDARSRSPGGGTTTNQTAGAQGDSDPTSRLCQWLVLGQLGCHGASYSELTVVSG